MKAFKLLTSLAITLITILFLNGNISIPGSDIPAFGKLLNPISGLWNNAENDNHFKDLELSSSHITAEVKVIYDDRLVPHIYAANLEDALYAQGYVEAQNRMFQMDFIKRLASGELSEVLGKRTLELDKQQRRKALKYGAENAIKGWKDFPELKYMDAYANGINDFLSTVDEDNKSVEHKLIGMPVRKWSTEDGALVSKWMADVLCGRASDIQYSNLREVLGQERFDFLYPDVAQSVDPVIPEEVDYDFDTLYVRKTPPVEELSLIDIFKDDLYPQSPKGIGSNNWAVNAEKSVYNAPIFANDPHLNLTLPSIWYEVGIHTPEFNAYGVTIPGMPGLMMGYNDHIAWGETNVGQDVKDFFLIKWKDKDKREYIVDGQVLIAEERIESFKVKGDKVYRDTVLYTIWGPVSYESEDGQTDYAMRWLALDIPKLPEFMTFVDGMRSKNYQEYLQATEPFVTPAQNFAFASKYNEIGLRVNGIFPAKEQDDGKYVEDGSISDNNWQAFIPKEQNPQVYNPKRGFIASANQRSADNGYPYYYNARFEYSRNRSINDFLRENRKFDIEDMKSFQLNNRSKQAMDVLPLIISALEGIDMNDDERVCHNHLRNWNYEYNKDSEDATVFNEIWTRIRNITLDEIYQFRDSFSITYPEQWRLVEIMKDHPEDEIFDVMETPETETMKEVILKAFQETAAYISEEKEKGNSLEWGVVSPLDIYHLARIPPFSSTNMQLGGHPDALNAIGSTHGPSWRMVVALKDEMEAYGVFPGGQSGNPLSKYYKTSLQKWADGEYHELQNPKDPDQLKNKLYSITIHSGQ